MAGLPGDESRDRTEGYLRQIRTCVWLLVLVPFVYQIASMGWTWYLHSEAARQEAIAMSVGSSVRDHFESVDACVGAISGIALKTTWTSGGSTESKETEKDPGQTDAEWKDDHKDDVVFCMLNDVPDLGTDINTGRFDVDGEDVSITTTVE